MNTFIESAYKSVIEQYQKSFPNRFAQPEQREWFKSEFPHLVRDESTFPVLYDMNVNSPEASLITGMCLPTALFVKTYMQEVHSTEVELIGLWDGPTFCHCVVYHDGKYHDGFIPEGTEEPSKILFASECTHSDVELIVSFYMQHDARNMLNEHIFDPVKKSLYNA